MSEFDFDFFVIGAGSGGVRAARLAAVRIAETKSGHTLAGGKRALGLHTDAIRGSETLEMTLDRRPIRNLSFAAYRANALSY